VDDVRSDSHAVPPAVRAAADWSWRLLLICAAIAVGGWLLGRVQTILVPVIIALLITIMLMPVRTFLVERAKFPRGLAVTMCVLGLIAFVGLLIFLATRQLAGGFSDLQQQVLAGVNQIRNWLITGPLDLHIDEVDEYWQQLQGMITNNLAADQLLAGARGAATTAGSFMVGIAVALMCIIFFLLDGKTIWTWLVSLLPRAARERVHQAGRRGLVTLANYMNIQILVAFIDAVGIGLGMLFFIPHLAFPIGALVFIGSFIPVAGAIITGTIAAIVVLVSNGLVPALIMAAIVLAVQQLESSVLRPILMGHAVSLHPLAVVLVVAVASMLWGIPGALLGVPLAAVANTVVQYLFGNDKYPELGDNDNLPILRTAAPFDEVSVAALTGALHLPNLPKRPTRQGHDESPN